MSESVILHDAGRGGWLRFQRPVTVVAAHTPEEVLPALREAEALVNGRGLHAAGFVSYEAAPGFDPVLKVREAEAARAGPAGDDPPGDDPPGRLYRGRWPLLWFGMYAGLEAARGPAEADGSLRRLDEGAWTPSVSRAEYDAALRCIKDQIAAGKTYQVNYTFRLRRDFDGDAWGLFARLSGAQQAQYAAFVDLGEWAIGSVSPELFFRREGRQVTARPMKGTARRGLTPEGDRAQAEWLRQSEKNRAENVMIVDMVRNDLGRVADIGSVRVPSLFEIERYPNVWQMTSTVTAETGAPLWEVMRALFPCASITGAPKRSTMGIIAALESTPRRIYTGCIGHFGPGEQAQFNVAIRTVLLDRTRGEAEFGVGGGIVWDSETESEYDECLDKARVLSAQAERFELLESLRWTPGGAEDGFWLLERHLRRLKESAEYFGFACDEARVRAALEEAARGWPREVHKVRVRLDRAGRVSVEAAPIAWPPVAAIRAALAPQPVDPEDRFLYHKTTQRAVYDAALRACPGCDDVVLWNERGEVTETCNGNLVAKLDGQLITPPIVCGLLPGTFRGWLLERGEAAEGVLRVNDLRRCEAVWRVNGVRGWQRVEIGE